MSIRAFGLIALCLAVVTIACSGNVPTAPDRTRISGVGTAQNAGNAAAALAALPLSDSVLASTANNESGTYEFELEVPNVAEAPNGDQISVLGDGTFSVHPKSASGGGTFTHTFASGGSASGTWTVNGLVAFQPYGCGVIFGTPIPPNLCGGRVVLDITLVGPLGPLPGQLTIVCLIGQPPASAGEGIRLVVPGIVNFNKMVSGMNVYIKMS